MIMSTITQPVCNAIWHNMPDELNQTVQNALINPQPQVKVLFIQGKRNSGKTTYERMLSIGTGARFFLDLDTWHIPNDRSSREILSRHITEWCEHPKIIYFNVLGDVKINVDLLLELLSDTVKTVIVNVASMEKVFVSDASKLGGVALAKLPKVVKASDRDDSLYTTLSNEKKEIQAIIKADYDPTRKVPDDLYQNASKAIKVVPQEDSL